MTIVVNSRTALDVALGDPRLTLLLISDDETATPQAVHDLAEEKVVAPFRRTFLIRDLAILTAAELASWFSGPGRYAVLGGIPKSVVVSGPISGLCNQDGSASILRILKAFSKGDQA